MDYLPQPIKKHPRYTHRPVERPNPIPLALLRADGFFHPFDDLFQMSRQGLKGVVARMYHWTDGEDLRMEDLTHGRLYFSYDPRHWAPSVPNGQALFAVDVMISKPVQFDQAPQRYEHVWRSIEDRLDAIKLERDVLFYTPCASTGEPPQGFVYDARKSILAVTYIGSAI